MGQTKERIRPNASIQNSLFYFFTTSLEHLNGNNSLLTMSCQYIVVLSVARSLIILITNKDINAQSNFSTFSMR